MTDLERITIQMRTLEAEIQRQQAYIAKHGESNDLNSDKQWEQYKVNAQYNLDQWDVFKKIRDGLKEKSIK